MAHLGTLPAGYVHGFFISSHGCVWFFLVCEWWEAWMSFHTL